MLLKTEKYQTITRTHFYLTLDSGTDPLTKKNNDKGAETTRVENTEGLRFLYWDDYEDYTDEG